MKKILSLPLAAAALLAAPLAQAWTYNAGDVLLLFRNTANPTSDVEFDLGSVNQFLGKTNGYTTTITNWSLSLAQSYFGSDFTGVSVALAAVTAPGSATPTAWVSGIEPDTTAYADNLSDWNFSYQSKISAVGLQPLNFSVPTAGTNAYAINPNGTYKKASYEYIVSAGTYNGVSQLGGSAPFIVEQFIPGSLDFWAVQPLESGGVSPADTLVGTFNITSAGKLTFTAGPAPAAITGITRAGKIDTVSFATTIGVHYQLVSTNKLTAKTAWPVVSSLLAGDGTSHSLSDTNTATTGFYKVTAQ